MSLTTESEIAVKQPQGQNMLSSLLKKLKSITLEYKSIRFQLLP